MHTIARVRLALLSGAIALLLVACGAQDGSAPAASAAAATDAGPAPVSAVERAPTRACDLVPAARMSAIVGSEVAATPDDTRTGKTLCTYAPAVPVAAVAPYIELSVEWGAGEAAMQASGMLNAHEPGLVDDYAGLGDQATRAGPAVMIRHGEDLVMIVISGVDDEPPAIRSIFDAVKSGL